jgi:hypothetical protein
MLINSDVDLYAYEFNDPNAPALVASPYMLQAAEKSVSRAVAQL